MPTNLVEKLRDFFLKTSKRHAVIGLSGGVDSAVVFALCVQALGAQNVHAYYLPYFENPDDTAATSAYAKALGAPFYVVPITPAVDALKKSTRAADPVDVGNLMARTRMAFLYSKARQHDALVVGTGNKTELSIGYFTKYGDGGVDVLPIGGLYKTEVWALARKMGVPQYFIDKPPSAGLWPDQTDESELGMTYAELDGILKLLETAPNQAVKQYGEKKVEAVLERMRVYGHKLASPPVL